MNLDVARGPKYQVKDAIQKQDKVTSEDHEANKGISKENSNTIKQATKTSFKAEKNDPSIALNSIIL